MRSLEEEGPGSPQVGEVDPLPCSDSPGEHGSVKRSGRGASLVKPKSTESLGSWMAAMGRSNGIAAALLVEKGAGASPPRPVDSLEAQPSGMLDEGGERAGKSPATSESSPGLIEWYSWREIIILPQQDRNSAVPPLAQSSIPTPMRMAARTTRSSRFATAQLPKPCRKPKMAPALFARKCGGKSAPRADITRAQPTTAPINIIPWLHRR
mmetsp:Transcript_13573/g.29869  ORF Transcript_13573/g.29869 Transcript_13573/m.29869 type:complete len:210 (-) Transcript_13573:773-1402(-)